jgi:hypothetical protein
VSDSRRERVCWPSSAGPANGSMLESEARSGLRETAPMDDRAARVRPDSRSTDALTGSRRDSLSPAGTEVPAAQRTQVSMLLRAET